MLMKLIEGQRSICICNGESVKNYEQDEAEVVSSSSLVKIRVSLNLRLRLRLVWVKIYTSSGGWLGGRRNGD